MAHADENSGTPVQPSVAELMACYLQQRTAAHAAGLVAADATGEVVPFEAAPVQTVDPRLAWNEAFAAGQLLQPKTDEKSWQAPPDWPVLVTSQEPLVALAFALGNFPQLVRHVQPLLHAAKLGDLRPTGGPAIPVPELLKWATQTAKKKRYPETLLAVGVLRLARQFDKAETLLSRHRAEVPAGWQAALANEEAALAWHCGRGDEALTMWRGQKDSVPVLFNRGMAALFLGKAVEARTALNRAIEALPEDDAWHHLGRLYLALAQRRA
jgi:tetratricopeptide (TPR) repeat protein